MLNKRSVIAIVTALLAIALACGFPGATPDIDWDPTKTPSDPDTSPTVTPTKTATPMPMCTPPACAGNEVYYCPDDCLGGCGTECATGTPEPGPPEFTPSPTPGITPSPTVTHTPGPTRTPTPTSTPTATPVALQIITFLGSKTEINEGDDIQVSWDVRGADSAYIEWTDANRIRVRKDSIVLPEGLFALKPYRGLVILTASKGLNQVSATLNLKIGCPIPWATSLENLYPEFCPSDYNTSWAAYQPFEHGFMIWVESDDLIYVFYDHTQSYSYFWYVDNWAEGDPESDPTLIPPTGLLQPIRGFGLVWRSNPDVRTKLGWATAGEQGYQLHHYGYFPAIPSSRFDWFSSQTGAYYRMHPYTHSWSQVTP